MKFSDLKDFYFGTPDKIQQTPNYTPQQQSYLDMILQNLQGSTGQNMDWLQGLFDEEGFADFERPYKEQFEQQTIPNIMERFAGSDSKGSSGLNQTLAQAGRGLSGDLANQRSNLRMQATGQLHNYGNQALNQQSTPYVQQGQEGTIQQFIKLLSQAAASGKLGGF